MTEAAPMDFTGERFTPECVREIWYEHWHRYVFARAFARGKRVLDAACGEGYGSALLASEAASVLGVDIAEDAIAHARARYADRHANLRFERGDCTVLDLPAGSFDLITSFETLEHVMAQQALIDGFARVLATNGVLLISSPDKRAYSDVSGFRNEFHVRELYRDELLALLKPHFPFVHLYGQKLLFQSTIWSLDGAAQAVAAATSRVGEPRPGLDYDPLYFIAVCSRQPLSFDLPGVGLFGDREESVYQHYNGEVRKNMAAGARLAQLEAEVAALRRELENDKNAHSASDSAPPRTSWWRRLLGARTHV
jgi:SAM-dependent methyltransferase